MARVLENQRMENVYRQVVELLGKSPDDPVYNEFVQALGDLPEIFRKTSTRTDYLFDSSGIGLTFFEVAKCFGNLYLARKSDSRLSRNFPGGIEFGDDRITVEQKLGVKLTQHGEICDQSDCQIENLRLRFSFDKSTGELFIVFVEHVPTWEFILRPEIIGLIGDPKPADLNRFTDKAVNTIGRAHTEARMARHNFVGSEHILLGLLTEHGGTTGEVLKSVGINLRNAREEIERVIGPGCDHVDPEIHFVPSAIQTIELSVDEADRLDHKID
jgi:hypothetical protein